MNNIFTVKKIVGYTSVALIAMSGVGCTTFQTVEKDFKVNQSKVTKGIEAAKTAVVKEDKVFKRTSGFFVEKKPLASNYNKKFDLPKVLTKNIVINEPTVQPLSKIASRISQLAGVKVLVASDVAEGLDSSAVVAPTAAAPTPSANTATFNGSGLSSVATGSTLNVDPIYHTGSFYSLLDDVTSKLGLSWKWDGENVQIYKYDARVYTVSALTGDVSSDSNLGGQSSSNTGSGTGSSGQSVKMSSKFELWPEIATAVRALAGQTNVTVMQSTGQIVVKQTPLVHMQIEKFINDTNRTLSKQVVVNVEIYSVAVDDADNFGIDWNLVLNSIQSGNAVKYNFLAAGGGADAIKNGIVASLTDLGTQSNPTPFGGSKAVVGALSKMGNVSLMTSASMVTLNGLPVPIQVSRETAYVKSSTTTVTGTTGVAQTQIVPDVVNSGITLNITPRVTENNKVLVQYAVDMTDLIRIDSFTSGDATVQLPIKNVRNFLQRASMKSGDTLILSGFKQTYGALDSSGVGNAKNWAAGGGSASKSKAEIVVMITPVVIAGE